MLISSLFQNLGARNEKALLPMWEKFDEGKGGEKNIS